MDRPVISEILGQAFRAVTAHYRPGTAHHGTARSKTCLGRHGPHLGSCLGRQLRPVGGTRHGPCKMAHLSLSRACPAKHGPVCSPAQEQIGRLDPLWRSNAARCIKDPRSTNPIPIRSHPLSPSRLHPKQ
jgi:hypothetical protein